MNPITDNVASHTQVDLDVENNFDMINLKAGDNTFQSEKQKKKKRTLISVTRSGLKEEMRDSDYTINMISN